MTVSQIKIRFRLAFENPYTIFITNTLKTRGNFNYEVVNKLFDLAICLYYGINHKQTNDLKAALSKIRSTIWALKECKKSFRDKLKGSCLVNRSIDLEYRGNH